MILRCVALKARATIRLQWKRLPEFNTPAYFIKVQFGFDNLLEWFVSYFWQNIRLFKISHHFITSLAHGTEC
jgi:hypothetical protein